MSRRKQAKPIRHFEDEENGGTMGTALTTETRDEEEEELEEGQATMSSSEEPGSFNSLGGADETLHTTSTSGGGGEADYPSLFLNNNNCLSEDNEEDSKGHHRISEQLKSIGASISSLTASAASINNPPKSVQELAVLQATLFSLQQQQLLQMQILTQMQQQLQISSSGGDSAPVPSLAELAEKHGVKNSFLDGLLNYSSKEERKESSPPAVRSSFEAPIPSRRTSPASTPLPPSLPQPSSRGFPSQSISAPPKNTAAIPDNSASSLASSIIMHHDSPEEEKPPVNSLELLQQRAQGILNNASQGLLANNLADFGCGKDKEALDKKGEPFFKHRCRYCGKVFGSDSALQIHVRSHTGERPYKCNVCGNRFTTKGNLKVHFQRHSSKFPLVKMNPNLVPEHLDKFYPPLLQQIEDAEKKGLPPPPMNDPMAGMRPVIPPGMRLPTLPGMPASLPKFPDPPPAPRSHPLSGLFSSPFTLPSEPLKKDDPGVNSRAFPSPLPYSPPKLNAPLLLESSSNSSPIFPPTPEKSKCKEDGEESSETSEAPASSPPAKVLRREEEDDGHKKASSSSEDEDFASKEIKEEVGERMEDDEEEDKGQDEPENLSKSPPSYSGDNVDEDGLEDEEDALPLLEDEEDSEEEELRCSKGDSDPAKDPNVYTNLLPRPGSNDNAWESLIEVARPSDTAKLEALVNNIENKLSDPNECAICHRVLSCKSALQMHYRTHTGERPFKCRICGRAFTTKGNLKTHMGVHRAKPPMRMFHQCPVCHKKYANALVLQQHIKTHTGEPTELTSEQIAAAEIRDSFPFPGGLLRLPGSSSSGLFPGLPAGFAMSDYGPPSPDDMDDDLISNSDDKMEDGDKHHPSSSRPSSVVSSSSGSNQAGGLPPSSRAASASASSLLCNSFSTESLSKLVDRPFGLVRPFFMDRPALPEDLSPIRKPEEKPGSPHSPPKYSPPTPHAATANEEPEDRLTPLQSNLKTSRTSSPKAQHLSGLIPSSSSAAALDLTPQTTTSAGSSLLLSSFPGLISPGAHPGFPGSLLGTAHPGNNSPNSATGPGFNPLRLPFPVVPGMRLDPPFDFLARGNTTCQICFKVFACNSALEIHIRSHTKERPFKCEFCDRGFSTKGNMKQHALTHKTRGGSEAGGNNSSSSEGGRSSNNSSKDYSQPLTANVRKSSEGSNSADEEPKADPRAATFAKEDPSPGTPPPPPTGANLKRCPPEPSESNSAKRSFGGVERPTEDSGGSPADSSQRNYCQLCKKNFSSCSALQIHMRTHTGDRPFKCHVCGKAFTTKGNLKVHMGIHMWSNTTQASRRGRRMSLDLPRPPIPMTAKDSEFLQRRPELFYPYLQSSGGGNSFSNSCGSPDSPLLRPPQPYRAAAAAAAAAAVALNLPGPVEKDGFSSGSSSGGTPIPPSIRLAGHKGDAPSAKEWNWHPPSEGKEGPTSFHESIAA